MNHTPGPWTLGNENNSNVEICIGETLCSLSRDDPFTGKMVMSREEMLANAHLIMAAPELLAIVEKIVDLYTDINRWDLPNEIALLDSTACAVVSKIKRGY